MKHLLTPRLLMRPFSLTDIEDFHALWGDPIVMKYINGGNPLSQKKNSEVLEKLISNFEENGYGMYAMIERKEKRFIGQCGIQQLENTGLTELRFLLVQSAWGKGYATEASKEVLRTAFGEWELEKIVAIANDENRPSTRVLEKIGMNYKGRDKYYGQQVVTYNITNPQKAASALFQSSYKQPPKLSMSPL